ncbi:MAG: phosphoribosylaminoimidazolesuccinocarboxamide synthase [Deltaproteobacteria bacterium GWA2_57_13]|nr:MAG: phosphoribosylaminoimidazolesuccinocarboxamide synthase [Deltaproteobacteria bacterium GWA2_57_13]OGQ51219.1 MAG: phosphoribosylaminoimidazolesuccinocarboxamide synthase [Deltaproteobacteria bacterium RIFCSPLOWO2_02_FULL_57_26]OGQ84648.1 MAG: phosphoribosylaminoimidazolesuccinocarboxamide synthase [Deltaproteobacteria bacterium RIFCSPLOWO2_12_FULL_57_22]
MKRGEAFYEGKAKILYTTDDPDLIIQYFKDDATAFNAQKRGTIREKGIFNNKISEVLFTLLEGKGVPTHFVRRLNDREMLVRRLEIIPVEVIVRNLVAGSLAKRLGLEEGTPLSRPVLEHCYKSDALGDPMVNESYILGLGWATEAELREIARLAFRVNELLKEFFDQRNLILVDFKLEFGRHHGKVYLGDEICPDTCRLWEKGTLEKLDKDRFRRDLGRVEDAYQEVCRRVCS